MPRTPYPNDVDLMQFLADGAAFVKGKSNSLPPVLNSAWTAAGFGLGSMYPVAVEGQTMMANAGPPPELLAMSTEELANVAESRHAEAMELKERNSVGSLNWTELRNIALVLAMKIINKILGMEAGRIETPKITHPTVGRSDRPFTGSIK